MKRISVLLLLLFLARSLSAAAEERKTVNLGGIKDAGQIIGHLGKPLGTIVRVQGKVRIEPDPREEPDPKEGVDRYLVISSVDGEKLASPVELELFDGDLPDVANGAKVETKGFERLMTLGVPPGVERPGPVVAASKSDLEYRLRSYFDVIVDPAPPKKPGPADELPPLPATGGAREVGPQQKSRPTVSPYKGLLEKPNAAEVEKESTGTLRIESKTIKLDGPQTTQIKKLIGKRKPKTDRGSLKGIPWAFLTIDSKRYFFPANTGPLYESVVDGKECRYYEEVTAEAVRRIAASAGPADALPPRAEPAEAGEVGPQAESPPMTVGAFDIRSRSVQIIADAAAEERTTTGTDKTKEGSRELAIVGKCFDIGACTLGVDPTAHADLHQFLVGTKRKLQERGSDNRSADVLRKIDLANNKVSVSGKELRWRVTGTEHDSFKDGTALVRHYEIFSPTSKESLARTITIAIPR